MARFIVRRLFSMVARAVRDLGPDVPDLPGDPERRPGAAAGRPPRRRRRRSPAISQHVGLRQADLRAVPDDDEEDLHGRRSISYTQQVNVLDEIKRDLPATLSLAIGAGIIWLGLRRSSSACSARCSAGQLHRPRADRARAVGVSTPVFLLGALVLYFLALQGAAVPERRLRAADAGPRGDWLYHMILPWLVLSVLFIGIYSRVLRSNMLDTINEDYVRTARAKGITRAPRADPPRAAQLADPDRLAVRPRLRGGDRRRRDPHRVGLQPAGRRPVRGRVDPASSTCRRCW